MSHRCRRFVGVAALVFAVGSLAPAIALAQWVSDEPSS